MSQEICLSFFAHCLTHMLESCSTHRFLCLSNTGRCFDPILNTERWDWSGRRGASLLYQTQQEIKFGLIFVDKQSN